MTRPTVYFSEDIDFYVFQILMVQFLLYMMILVSMVYNDESLYLTMVRADVLQHHDMNITGHIHKISRTWEHYQMIIEKMEGLEVNYHLLQIWSLSILNSKSVAAALVELGSDQFQLVLIFAYVSVGGCSV